MDQNIRKRKKRKSLVQTVKKKFKKNHSGIKGTRLDADIHEYFLRVFEQSKQEFIGADNRRIFIENVFSQTEGHEIEYSSNQLVSRIIEDFLSEGSEAVLQRYLSIFGEDLRPLCCHQFASHVLEKLLKISSKKVFESRKYEGNLENSDQSEDVYLEFVVKVSKFLLNNLDEFILDTYANHVTRTAISSLCGVVGESDSKSAVKSIVANDSSSQPPVKKLLPKEFKTLLHQFAQWILNSHMFCEYANDTLLSGLVQSMLLSLQYVGNKKYLNRISLKLVESIYSTDVKGYESLKILQNQPAVHLLNTIIITSTDKVFEAIRCKCFTGRLKEMALSRTANYSVQKLIERSPVVESFDAIYDELRDSLVEILQSRHTGVLFSLSKMCNKLHTKEKLFIKDLVKSLGSIEVELKGDEITNFVLQLLTLGGKYPDCNNGPNNFVISLHGCLILQEMLKFKKPDKVKKSLLSLNSTQFLTILCDQKGSHIADAFFGCDMKEDKYNSEFMEKFKGSYVSLATNKYGSFVFSAMWKVADIDHKLSIVKELSNKESVLRNNPSGRFIVTLVGLETYRHQPKEWESIQKQLNNSRQLFSDVIK